jgi:formate hydrogenlyase transcriptional activator
MSGGSSSGDTTATERYRALLDALSAIADHTTVREVLRSLRAILSSTSGSQGIELYVLDDHGDTLKVFEFDRDPDGPPIKIGSRLSRVGAVRRALEEQRPTFIPNVSQEVLKHPDLACFSPEIIGRSAYLFPVSTSTKQYGILAVTISPGEECVPEDVELLSSLASHVGVVLECALAKEAAELAKDRAEQYQRELARERDRLRLLLEINNQMAKLDMDEVLRSASTSIRSYFGTDYAAFWVLNEETSQLQKVFSDSTGSMAKVGSVPADFELLRRRQSIVLSAEDIDRLPPQIGDPLKAESIASLAVVPLAIGDRILGLLTTGSCKPDVFNQEHLDLLSEISVQISLALDNALAYGRLNASAARLEEERLYLESEITSEYSFEEIVGKSAALRKVLDQVSIVAPTSSTVLLHGETGTGKELIARAIHNLSPRRDRTFVRLNCAAIPSGLVESELFGHEKGAFTGALMQKHGRFEVADRGTLFLDEIGDISLDLQPKLLRALQEHEFERLGSTKTIRVDVRLIAATHRDLKEMIRNNQFREDLYYRLNVFPIEIPPLRERREDIPLLIHYFVSRLSRRMQKRIKSIPTHAMDAMVNAEWLGNVRELENFLERCVILTQGDELKVPRAELKSPYKSTQPAKPSVNGNGSTFEDVERQTIIRALKGASGRVGGKEGAAERLGLKRTTLQHKMRRLNITREDYAS